jgi:hypothetical protein
MEDVTLSWPGKMTTEQAKKYLLTHGFVAVELYDAVLRGENKITSENIKQQVKDFKELYVLMMKRAEMILVWSIIDIFTWKKI